MAFLGRYNVRPPTPPALRSIHTFPEKEPFAFPCDMPISGDARFLLPKHVYFSFPIVFIGASIRKLKCPILSAIRAFSTMRNQLRNAPQLLHDNPPLSLYETIHSANFRSVLPPPPPFLPSCLDFHLLDSIA